MKTVDFVKLGGSLITDKKVPESLRREVLDRVAGEIASTLADRRNSLVVGHGSGSFGHVAATAYGLRSGPGGGVAKADEVSAVQAAAHSLHREVVSALRLHGVPALSFLPSSFLVADDGLPRAVFAEPLHLALDAGAVAVTLGDVVADRRRAASICSTETVFEALLPTLSDAGYRVGEMFWMGETEGIWDADGQIVPTIGPVEMLELETALRGSSGTDVTGGMRHRLETVWRLAGLGATSSILDGRVAGRMSAALRGESVPGTRIPARTDAEASSGC